MISERLVFKPDKQTEGHPSDVGLEFEEIWLRASDGIRLHAWHFPGPREVALVWFHGNSGNISHRLDTVRLLHDRLGASILLFDYRGYGRSEGHPTERGVYRDGDVAVQWVRQHPRLGKQPIVFFGRSLGSAIAVEMATRSEPAGIVLEAAFLSIQEVAKKSPSGRFVTPLFATRFNTAAKINRVRAPILVIHGDRDEDVPFSHGLRLFKGCAGPKWMYTVAGAGHADVMQVAGEPYFEAMHRFIERLDRHGGVRPENLWLEV